MSVLDGPGEGTWSVYAGKMQEERDAAIEHAEELRARCDTLMRERDEYRAKVEKLQSELKARG